MPSLPQKILSITSTALASISLEPDRLIVLQGAFYSFATKAIGAALVLITQALAARFLGAQRYGNYVYALTWLNILVIGGKLGFDISSLKFIATYQNTNNWTHLAGFLKYGDRVVLIASLIIAAVFILTILALQPQLSYELLTSLSILGCAVPFLANLQVQQQRLRSLQKILQSQIPQEIILPATFLVTLLFVQLMPGLHTNLLTVSLLHGTAIITAWSLSKYWLNQNLPAELKQPIKAEFQAAEWLQVSFHMMLISSFSVVLSQTDIVMIGLWGSTTEAGFYAVAAKIAALLVFALVSVNAILAPIIVKLHMQGNTEKLQKLVSMGANGSFSSAIVIAITIMIFRLQILAIFGNEFISPGEIFLTLLIIGQVINAAAGPVGLLLNMTGHQESVTKILGISALCNIMLNLALIPIYGGIGAAISTVLTTAFWNIAMIVIARQKLGIVATIKLA